MAVESEDRKRTQEPVWGVPEAQLLSQNLGLIFQPRHLVKGSIEYARVARSDRRERFRGEEGDGYVNVHVSSILGVSALADDKLDSFPQLFILVRTFDIQPS